MSLTLAIQGLAWIHRELPERTELQRIRKRVALYDAHNFILSIFPIR